MRSGRMRDRIVIQQKSTSTNDIGAQTESWSTLATVWAEIRQERGSEFLRANREVAQEYMTVFIRYRDDVTAQNRISFNSKIWDIENIRVIDTIKRKDGLEIVARAHD